MPPIKGFEHNSNSLNALNVRAKFQRGDFKNVQTLTRTATLRPYTRFVDFSISVLLVTNDFPIERRY